MRPTKEVLHGEFVGLLDDSAAAVFYLPLRRDFLVGNLDPGDAVRHRSPEGFVEGRQAGWSDIAFCPFTGEALPSSLYVPATQYIIAKFGGEPLGRLIPGVSDPHIFPYEFVTTEWWLNTDAPDVASLSDEIAMADRYKEFPSDILDASDPHAPFIEFDLPGLTRFPGRPPHLCHELAARLSGHGYMYAYFPWAREYGFRVIDLDTRIGNQRQKIAPAPHARAAAPGCPRPRARNGTPGSRMKPTIPTTSTLRGDTVSTPGGSNAGFRRRRRRAGRVFAGAAIVATQNRAGAPIAPSAFYLATWRPRGGRPRGGGASQGASNNRK